MFDEGTSEMNLSPLALPADYAQWLAGLKQRIQGAPQRALLAANGEQIRLYHDIGREIMDRQSRQGWGAKVICLGIPDRVIGQQSADQLPWFHIVTLITKLHDPALREWYAREAVAQSWPRDTLNIQIKNQLHLR